jgi:hypothetical protein
MAFEDAVNGLVQQILRVLPLSPFADMINQFADLPFLGYLNWFFPVRGCLSVMAAWLAAVTAFYLYSVIARWVKLIGD